MADIAMTVADTLLNLTVGPWKTLPGTVAIIDGQVHSGQEAKDRFEALSAALGAAAETKMIARGLKPGDQIAAADRRDGDA